jgi:hypothetical protein
MVAGIKGVQIGPGATLFTRIPFSPNSCAKLAEKFAMAALVAAYGASVGEGISDFTDELPITDDPGPICGSKDVLSDELPYVTGAIGLLGTRPSYELMRDCDTLLIVGSNFPYSQFLPKYDAARAVQIDIDGSAIGMRYPTELNAARQQRLIEDRRALLDDLSDRFADLAKERTPAERGVDEPDVATEDQCQVVAGHVDDVAAGTAVGGEVCEHLVVKPSHRDEQTSFSSSYPRA